MKPCDSLAWQAAHRARLQLALAAALPAADTYPARLHTAMRYAAEGGKRLRALLVYAAGTAAGAPPEMLDTPAVAIELIHAFSLVHDDLPAMDNDDLRRGRATVHKAFDEATAILAGDGLQTRAFEVLIDPACAAPSDRARLLWLKALAAATGSLGMIGGQAVDIDSEHSQLTLPQLEQLHQLKTGALISASLRMGLIAGAAASELSSAVELYGAALGLAYQIQDDVLDVEGSSASLGKTAGKDALAKKSTYVSLLGLAAARDRVQALLDSAVLALAHCGSDAEQLRQLAETIRRRSH